MSMLEANADRSYFMIGAVIVAAVLITGALWIFRDVIFGTQANPGYIRALVSDVFDNAKEMVGKIGGKTGGTISIFKSFLS